MKRVLAALPVAKASKDEANGQPMISFDQYRQHRATRRGCLPNAGRQRRRGVSATEAALIFPFVFLFLIYPLQIAFYLVSHQVTQYAAFMAARAYHVHGELSLGDINYPYTSHSMGSGAAGGLYTSNQQTVAESVAERIIFEALPWEHSRISVVDRNNWFMKRQYADGIDNSQSSISRGAVRVGFSRATNHFNLPGVDVTYCMPVIFPGLEPFFTGWRNDNSCNHVQDPNGFGSIRSIPIHFSYYLGREPVQ